MNIYAQKPKKKSGHHHGEKKKKEERMPHLSEFVRNRDYTGAKTLLEFKRHVGATDANTVPWLCYSLFHLGDYKAASETYLKMLNGGSGVDQVHWLHLGCCLFYMGQYQEAIDAALKGPANQLQNRVIFQAAHKLNDERRVFEAHGKITESVEDQLCLASYHYQQNHFQEATDIYKRLLIANREFLALQVYVALCYYKLDYYDVSLDILAPYLSAYPDSGIAINLKACNHYKLYDGKNAEAELKTMLDQLNSSATHVDNDLVRLNLVVFRNGENAQQALPPLLDLIPEARLNLVIYHLRHNEIPEAFELMKNVEPTTPQEFILKGVVNATYGQLTDSKENLKLAQQFFQLVGASASECDTIPGRQCMASCFFLLKQFDDSLIYLNSVKAYSYNDDIFNFDFGLALAASGNYREAEEALLLVTDERYKVDFTYLSWLARSYIMNGKSREAWEIYPKLEQGNEGFQMLLLIANDCYKVGAFYYSAKAFDVLERLDPNPDYWEGKRGACCGVLQMVVARKEKKEALRDVVQMLKHNAATPQAEQMIRVMSRYVDENR